MILEVYTRGEVDYVGQLTADELDAVLTLALDRLEDLEPRVAVELGLAAPGVDPTEAVERVAMHADFLRRAVREVTS